MLRSTLVCLSFLTPTLGISQGTLDTTTTIATKTTNITFKAIIGDDGPLSKSDLIWALRSREQRFLIDDKLRQNGFNMDVTSGRMMRIDVRRPADGAQTHQIFSADGDSMVVTLVLPTLPSLKAVATAVAGSDITVGWDAPFSENDLIIAAKPDGESTFGITSSFIKNQNPVSITMPITPGQYQLRYLQGQSHIVLAERKITITPVTATLSAPDEVYANSYVLIDWQGPGYSSDFISLAKPDVDRHNMESLEYTGSGNPAKLLAPPQAGEYELRYVVDGSDGMIIHRRKIMVKAIHADVSFENHVAAASTIKVTWEGPNDKDDYLSIAKVGSDADSYLIYVYTRDNQANTLEIPAPTIPGTYEIRYMHDGNTLAILAAKNLIVVK